jgi:hypothetical protein
MQMNFRVPDPLCRATLSGFTQQQQQQLFAYIFKLAVCVLAAECSSDTDKVAQHRPPDYIYSSGDIMPPPNFSF